MKKLVHIVFVAFVGCTVSCIEIDFSKFGDDEQQGDDRQQYGEDYASDECSQFFPEDIDSEKKLRKIYRSLSLLYHPDKCSREGTKTENLTQKECNTTMQEINKCYEELLCSMDYKQPKCDIWLKRLCKKLPSSDEKCVFRLDRFCSKLPEEDLQYFDECYTYSP